MALLVQKFGGTSVGSIERIEAVAERVIKARQQGHQIVVVVSAMAGDTNRLLGLARQIDEVPTQRELDVLLSAGEQVTIALLAMALNKRGFNAISLIADQVAIRTDNAFNNANIIQVETEKLETLLGEGNIVVVAGFQGRDSENNITTLGRGGSDTTAVAIAGALKADECQIFTDVDGVYSTDPRVVADARRLPSIHFDDMTSMARHGAKVLQLQSVEYANHHKVPLRVLSSFEDGEGTLVNFEPSNTEGAVGVAIKSQQVLTTVAQPLVAVQERLKLFGLAAWCYAGIDDSTYIVTASDDLARLKLALDKVEVAQEHVTTLSVIGVEQADVVEKIAATLAESSLAIYQQQWSARCLSLLIDGQDQQLAVSIIHKQFVVEPESLDNRRLLAVS
ncbi:aspartate kinase [Photobacterium sanctipauli]|uniref:Aspartokinase n=1 Tax=Photobacterium sanctipauli TaxID=1342794 RepID=A0A2T3NQW6_9GAMM|nr:aspartate kinase [Photobacterium sanctipauli]PSW18638.1 aspartate kinase [Photobacterium sanctipauli]